MTAAFGGAEFWIETKDSEFRWDQVMRGKCYIVKPDGSWLDINCGDKRSFACEYTDPEIGLRIMAEQAIKEEERNSGCQNSEIDPNLYSFHKEGMGFREATRD